MCVQRCKLAGDFTCIRASYKLQIIEREVIRYYPLWIGTFAGEKVSNDWFCALCSFVSCKSVLHMIVDILRVPVT